MNRTLLFTVLLAASAGAVAHDHDDHGPGHSIDKVNGSITAQAGQSYGDLSTVNGGIDLQRGARVEDVETVNGGIEAEDEVSARSVSTVNGGIRLGQRTRVDGDVETVNGGIFLDRGSNVRRGVSTVNGGIGLVDTDLGGGIETVNGDISVGVGSHVKGGIHVEKPNGNWGLRMGKQKVPKIVIGPDAVVEGNLVFEREVKLYVHQSARIGNVSGATVQRYSTATPPKD
ncbi:hypothetical protein [Thermomonas aquatica]|uniref:Polymer-forming cytoskeletal protein n=1 Tax=Thermomonas aquatica TaxID=2202149 RepID=A0A5B7ZSS1_9GAMM|nr:hypothetical protein [Thermomonas aquatica]QDA57536.1 hypothetical protein FHQ07_09585 [Thermomonas aquatica]